MITKKALAVTALALGIAGFHTDVAAARTARPIGSQAWLAFRDSRTEDLGALAQPLLDCVPTKGAQLAPDCHTTSTKLQTALGLTLLYKLTLDQDYATAADVMVAPKNLGSLDHLDRQANGWLLALAREREFVTKKKDLRAAATKAAESLESELVGLDDRRFAQGIMFGGEDNLALPLLHLWQWSQFTADTGLGKRITTYTKDRVISQTTDGWCPLPIDSEPENFEFLPPCLQRAMTVLAVMPEATANPWLSEFMRAQTGLEPIKTTPLDTHASLNFSRGWALWSVYKNTGNGAYRDLYAQHLSAQLDSMARRQERGDQTTPAVAAFGVYAVALSYDRRIEVDR